MHFYLRVFELIDFGSFSSVWYWMILAVFWSMMSHYVLGVPHDMVIRASRGDTVAQRHMLVLVDVHADRLIYYMRSGGPFLVGTAGFVLTALAVLGWGYDVEICQAILFIAAPATLIFALSVNTAYSIDRTDPDAARASLRRQRVLTQVVGLFSILLTSMWGMYVNMISSGGAGRFTDLFGG